MASSGDTLVERREARSLLLSFTVNQASKSPACHHWSYHLKSGCGDHSICKSSSIQPSLKQHFLQWDVGETSIYWVPVPPVNGQGYFLSSCNMFGVFWEDLIGGKMWSTLNIWSLRFGFFQIIPFWNSRQ